MRGAERSGLGGGAELVAVLVPDVCAGVHAGVGGVEAVLPDAAFFGDGAIFGVAVAGHHRGGVFGEGQGKAVFEEVVAGVDGAVGGVDDDPGQGAVVGVALAAVVDHVADDAYFGLEGDQVAQGAEGFVAVGFVPELGVFGMAEVGVVGIAFHAGGAGVFGAFGGVDAQQADGFCAGGRDDGIAIDDMMDFYPGTMRDGEFVPGAGFFRRKLAERVGESQVVVGARGGVVGIFGIFGVFVLRKRIVGSVFRGPDIMPGRFYVAGKIVGRLVARGGIFGGSAAGGQQPEQRQEQGGFCGSVGRAAGQGESGRGHDEFPGGEVDRAGQQLVA